MKPFGNMKPRRALGGFTATEVLMVIALLAAMLALLIPLFFNFEGTFLKRPAAEQVRRAFAEAHRLAQVGNEVIFLHYDEEQETIRLSDEQGEPAGSIALPPDSVSRMRFYRVMPEAEMSSEPAFEIQEHSLDRVPFAPFGTSAIEVAIETEQNVTRLVFDPFTPLTWITRSE